MKITGQSIEWLGDDETRVTTTRSKGGRGFGFARVGPVGVGAQSKEKTGQVTETIRMDYERYKYERGRIESGYFRRYDPEKFYRYEDTPAAKLDELVEQWKARFAQWREQRQDRQRVRKRELQESVNGVKAGVRPPRTKWYWAIVGATLYWLLMIALTGQLALGSVLYWVLSGGWAIAWLVLPLAIYQDCEPAASYAPNWFPRKWAYVIGALVPYLSVLVAGLYLYRRRQYGQETSVNSPEAIPD